MRDIIQVYFLTKFITFSYNDKINLCMLFIECND